MQTNALQQGNSSVQSSGSLVNRLEISPNDEDTDEQQYSQFYVTSDCNSLFWAITLAYLIPVTDDDALFPQRYMDLFGNEETVVKRMLCVRKEIHEYNPFSHNIPKYYCLHDLVLTKIRKKVVDYMGRNLCWFKDFPEVVNKKYRIRMRNSETWGGDPEIQAFSLMLNCRIYVDGKCFPRASTNAKMGSQRIILSVFYMNSSTAAEQKEIIYNYMLEKSYHEYLRKSLIDYTYSTLDKFYSRIAKTGIKIPDLSCTTKDLGNNISGNSEECDTQLREEGYISKVDVIADKVICRISIEEIFKADCLRKLLNFLKEYKQSSEQENKTVNDNIRDICCLFRNTEHVGNIFRILNNSEEKDLLKCAFVILTFLIEELNNNGEWDLVYDISKIAELDFTVTILFKIGNSDFDILHFIHVVALTMNNKNLFKEASPMLRNIIQKLAYGKSSSILYKYGTKNEVTKNFYLSLLSSPKTAFSKHLLGNCEESYKEYQSLHDRIIEHLGITIVDGRLSNSIYKEILLSEKYQAILALNQEYLCILRIRENIANELTCIGNTNKQNVFKKEIIELKCFEIFRKANECYKNAIILLEDNFLIKCHYTEFENDIGKDINLISYKYKMLGDLYLYYFKMKSQFTSLRLNETLTCYYMSFELTSVSLSNLSFWHPMTLRHATTILHTLNNISLTHAEGGFLYFKSNSKSAIRHFEKAIYILESYSKFYVKYFGAENPKTVQKQDTAKSLKQYLDELKLACNLHKSE